MINDNDNDDEEIDLGKLLGTLLDGKWLIILTTTFFTAVGIGYALLGTPVYKADALVQVEEKNSGLSSFSQGASEIFAQESSAVTEIEIIKSRMILGQSVDKFNLTTLTSPNYFPIVGKGWTRVFGKPASISIKQFTLPEGATTSGYQLKITEVDEYQLLDEQENIILSGKVGVFVDQDNYQLLVQQLQGEKGQLFNISKRSNLNAISWLQRNLLISEKSNKSGILSFSFSGENKAQVKAILNDISTNYFLQNLARNTEEAKNSLAFINEHLPEIKNKLTEYEETLNRYKEENKSVDLSLETQATLRVMVNLEAQLSELTFKESEISQRFTKSHPVYISLLDKRKVLVRQKAQLNNKIKGLPKTQRAILRITRDVEVNQVIYLQLLNKKQELGIVQASTVGNVRILDNAQVYDKPIKPKKQLIVAVASLLGAVLSIGYLMLKSFFNRGIESAEQIEKLGLSVYATIPKSAAQEAFSKKHSKNKKNNNSKLVDVLLAESNAADLAIEALRALRTSLHFAMLEAKNNIIMISGPSPSIGKSFIAVNLAAVIAKSSQKVLLIDGDMRKGKLAAYLGIYKESGLSDILVANISVAEAVYSVDNSNLDFIAKGKTPPNPSELLLHSRFKELLEWATKEYDIIIVDTPPILAVTDAVIIAEHCGTTLLTCMFAKTVAKEIEISVERLAQAGVNVKGVVLNAVEKTASSSYGYGYYNYSYKSDKTPPLA